jgi:single-stranded-DNA-specific exonuclease
MDRAVEMLEDVKDIEDLNSLVLHHPDWHLGVIGIVASRLVDKFYRPTIMLSTVDGLAKGSARSIQGFNVYEALKECEDMLIQFGGHEYAAGLTLKEEDIAEFRKRFNLIVDKHLSEKIFEPELAIDAMLNLEDVNTKFWKVLRQFEPFGPMNMRPIFTSENVKVTMTPTIVGNGHIKFKVRQGNSAEFEAIGFNMHEYLPLVRDSEPGKLCIAYVLDENHWNGRTSLQLRLKDVKKMED